MSNKKNEWISLPFVIPKYQTYPLNTAINGILEAYGRVEEWLFNNYILLWENKWDYNLYYLMDFKFETDEFGVQSCPMIKTKEVEIGEDDNVIDYVCKKILERNYIFASVDFFYIDDWWPDAKHKWHCEHQMLILGFNEKIQKFLVADFFKGVYSVIAITYNEFKEAWYAHQGYLKEKNEVNHTRVQCFQFVENKYEINMERIKNLLYDFVYSQDNTIKNYLNFYEEQNVVYGIECFEILYVRIKKRVENQEEVDFKLIHLIYIFNDIMCLRIDYLIKEKYILDSDDMKEIKEEFNKLTNLSKMLRNLIIKYNLTLKESIGNEIIDRLKRMFDEEIDAIGKLYNQLM